MRIKRQVYLNRLISRIDNGMIKIITGVRRSGKSFLLFELFYEYLLQKGTPEDHIITISLDADEFSACRDPDVLSAYISKKIKDQDHYFIFIDEVQLAITTEELKKKDGYVRLYGVLNGLLHKRNVDVFVTGSNSKLLSTDVLTEFRGRGDEIRIQPLSFSEYYPAHGGAKREAWLDYLMYGGLPHILELPEEEQKSTYLDSLNREIYFKDISERYGISNLSGMEELMRVIASDVGALTNPRKISDTFRSSGMKGVTEPTIKTYLSYLQDACLIGKAERYDVKGRHYISTPAKYYYADTGLRNALLGFRQFEETHLMENVIYNELIRRGFAADVGVVKTSALQNNGWVRKQLEIDFVANQGSRRYYIQSAYSIPDREKMRQEQESLVRVPDSFKKIIVTADGGPVWRNDAGITIMNIFDFLLDENSLEK